MNDEALAVADIGEVRKQLHVLDQLPAGIAAAFDAESEDRAGAFWQILLGERAIGARRQGRIVDPADRRMVTEEIRDFARVGNVALHSNMERLEALQQQEGIE